MQGQTLAYCLVHDGFCREEVEVVEHHGICHQAVEVVDAHQICHCLMVAVAYLDA